MAKQLNVSLAFTADTSQAKNAIQSLVNDLNKLSSNSGLDKDLPITKEILEAQIAAKQLGETLKSSFNVESGKLDLTKFTQQLKSSGMSLSEYGNKLSLLGTQGDQAFLKIAQSIAKTQTPLRQSSKLLTEFATTLKNTARWQISSSVLHGFMGAVQSAYGYAQNLDKSLNNIRIVTGQNAEQMAAFAEQANKAAKALSTTTTEYTNASLIYYQQGLTDEEVAKRTEITIKMANAAGQSAEIVSDQLTAVWNNFYDGSKTLEYYADVMTALGAATASSTDEIAGGLEKFAAIGETIGLSYEYAASALATITSNTRQSEEVVGTALKTIFARIQGLNLGETLDDGTTLNKYSKALESVGISIFDSAGEMKKMDAILDEMAAKWDTLSKAQQAALAQTVAGTRQYTQLVALMDNWNNGDSDSMVANLETSYGATGALQEQADIYAESWEASRDRVTASLETIYNSLIDEEFFIKLNDTFSKLLDGVSAVIDSMGGLKGIIGLAGIMLTKYFGADLTQGINNALSNFRIFTGVAQEDMAALKKEAYESAMAMTEGLSDSPGIQSLRESLKNTYTLQNDLTNAVKRMSPEQRAVAEEALKTAQYYNDIAVEAGLAAEKAEELYVNSLKATEVTRNNAMNTMQQHYDNSVGQAGSELLASARGMKGSAADLGVDTSALDAAIKKYSNALHDDSIDQSSEVFKKITETLRRELDAVAAKAEESSNRFKSFEEALQGSATKVVYSQKEFEGLKEELSLSGKSGQEFADGVKEAAEAAKNAGGKVDVLERKLAKYQKLISEGKQGTEEFEKAETDLRRELEITHVSTEQATQQVAKLANTSKDGSSVIKVLTDEQIKQADAARQSVMANSNAGEAIKVAGEKSAQATAKIKYTALAYQSIGSALTGTLGAISSFAMGLNSLKSIYDTLNNTELSTFEKTTQIMMSLSMAIPALMSGLKGVGNAFHFVFSAQKKGLTGQIAYLLGAKQEIATDKLLVIGKNGEVLARGAAGDAAVIEALKTEGATTVTKLDTAATWANIAAKMVKYWYIGVIIVAIGILIGVVYSLVKAYNAEAEAAQLAAEKAEKLKESYEETKQAAEDLKSTIDKYKDARDSMSGLKKGTLEYKEALLEANEQALELLNTYEGLAKYASRNSEGLIVISNEGLDEILNQQLDLLNRQQVELYKADLDASLAKEVSDIVNFARSQGIDEDVANDLLSQITQYFEQNSNVTGISGIDLDMFSAYNNATEEQQALIEKNIEKYNAMARQLMATNTAQELLTDAYLDAEYRLRHPDAELGEDGAANTYDLLNQALYENYKNTNLTDANKNAYISEHKQQADKEFMQQYVIDHGLAGQGALDAMLTQNAYENITGHGGIDAARDYAELYKAFYGLDGEVTAEWGDDKWAQMIGFFGIGNGGTFNIKHNGNTVATSSPEDIYDDIAIIKGSIQAQADADYQTPLILDKMETFTSSLGDLNFESFRNLLASNGELVNAGMSQETAKYIQDNWATVTAAFAGYEEEIGFWTELGYESYNDYLNTIKTWIDKRVNVGDEEALTTERVTLMKTASDTVSSDLKSGKLTSENAESHSGFIGLVGAAEQLAQLYPDLIDEAETLANTNIVGSKQWVEAYNTVADKINDLDAAAKNSTALQELKNLTGEDYHSFFNELSPEEQRVFYKVDFDRFQSKDAIKSELTRLQGIADENEIQVKISAIETASELLKEDGMTTEDWIGIRDSGIEWGKEGVIQFTEFLAMSYEEQSRYLSRIQADQNEALENVKKSTLANLYQDLANLPDDTDNYEVEYEAIQNNIKALEEELMILEKVNIAKELEDYEIDSDEYEDMAEVFRDLADAGAEGYEALKNNEEAVKDSTVRYLRMNEAIEDLYDNYDDYVDVLKDVKSASTKADKVMAANSSNAKALRASLAGLLGTSEDLIGADLLDAIDPKDFKAAAEGDAAAIERIRDAFIDLQAFGYLTEEEIAGLKAELDAFNDGAVLDLNTDTFLNQLIQAWVNAGLTADEIENRLSGMNIDADVTPFNEAMAEMVNNADAAGSAVVKSTSYTQEAEVVEEPTPNTNSTFTEHVDVGYRREWVVTPMNGGFMPVMYQAQMPYFTKTVETGSETDESTTTAVGITTTNGDGESGDGGVIIQNAHKSVGNKVSTGNSTKPSLGSSSGGGSSSKPSTIEKRDTTQQSDVVERYREINDAIDNVTDALTRAERATDRLWGKDKLNAMREENKILEEQRDLILDKAKEAEEYAKQDAKNLRDVAKDIGVSVVIDQNTGDITNIEDVEETLYNRLAAAEAEYNAKVEAYNKYVNSLGEKPTEAQVKQAETMKDALDAYEKDVLGKIEDDIDAWEDAEQQFQESVETWEDAGLEAEEILDQIMQNNYDIIMEGLEIPLSLNEEDLRLLELQLAQIEDDVYSMAEAVALTSDQFGEYQDNLRLADEALAELNKARELGKQGLDGGITEAAYQEGLAEIRDRYYENIEALMELDKTMTEYYGNTIDMANEELSKYTDQIEHQTSVLEHYQSLIELMGKSNDYDMMGKVLEGQVKTTRDALDVSTEWYNKQRENADSLAADYAAAQARGASEAELEIIKDNWDAAEAAANEAQDKMLSDAEAWAESLKAVLENNLSKLGQTLENALTGGTSFDTINTQWERAQSLQEEYLTTTNQIYETNKLMRTAQQEIDKTTNSAAKKRLKAYIEETEQLQNQSKLSQYELEIQQAKYDLLLAEMALEEAQDAKSTVRLQRDAEGNFGYVYTADSSKLAEAQQQLEDAQNSLYNIGLEGANDYAQKYQQTLAEMYDTYADIQQQKLNGAFETEEEYHRAMEEAKNYYYQKLQDYSGLYSVAVSADSRVVADAWSSDFADMVYNTENWMDKVVEYENGVKAAFLDWQNAVSGEGGVSQIVGNSVEEVGGKVKDVTDKSHELAETTTKEVIPALDAELDAVQNMTGAYAAMRQEIQDVIEEYTALVNRMNNAQTEDWNSGDSGENSDESENNGSNSGSNSGEGSNSNGDNSNSSGDSGSSGSGTDGSSNGNNTTEMATSWDNIMKAYNHIVAGEWGNGIATRIKNGVAAGYTEEIVRAAQQYINYTFPRSQNGLGYSPEKAKKLMGFETGGYTGDWAGSYGKLALLHKKEIVLNENDTNNLLQSMEVLDRIIEMIDLQSLSSQLGGVLTTPAFGLNNTSDTFEQRVHIEASFPAVQDRNEIEEAFTNLINKASQYANRK